VVGGAAGNRKIQVTALQQPGRGGAVRLEPAIEHVHHPLGEDPGLEYATVEEHGRGVEEAAGGFRCEALQVVGGTGLHAEKGGQVARDRRVLGIGETELGERGAGTAGGTSVRAYLGEEAFHQRAADLVAGEFGADAAADELAAPARHHHRHAVDGRIREDGLLRLAAAVGEGLDLPLLQ
jgi:hypothetical protein